MQNVYAFLRKMRQMMGKYRCYVGVRLITVDLQWKIVRLGPQTKIRPLKNN